MAETMLEKHGSNVKLGVLTKTIVRSPVIRWILPARLRHRRLNDVVLVGEDFIQVSEVKKGGHVETIASKQDFGSRICSAAVFSIEDLSVPDETDITHYQAEYDDLPQPILPAQLLVLVLQAPIIIFLYVKKRNGAYMFDAQRLIIPEGPGALLRVGEHIAVDPHSRAMAIASRGGQVILYAAKDMKAFRQDLANQSDHWCPVTQEAIISGHNSLQHVAFLHPQHTDAAEHVILLLVVVDPAYRRTRLTWYDWRKSRGILHRQTHDSIPFEAPRSVASLLIPLFNTNFILVYGRELRFYKNLLSGTLDCHSVLHIDEDWPPTYPGNSPQHPLWVNWCRPMRSPLATQIKDCLYICREDGKVFLLDVYQNGSKESHFAGDLACHVGQAFASLGDDRDPDLLAVAADMSTGRVVSIGEWAAQRLNPRSRTETMDPKLVQLLPNWTSVTDMFMRKSSQADRDRDKIYLSSGRQPYGTITEIRKGLEARLSLCFETGSLRSMLDVWALPNTKHGSVNLLMSTPETTSNFVLSATGGEINVEHVDGVFITDFRTITADITSSNLLVQVTTNTVFVTDSIDDSFDDKKQLDRDIICAVIEPSHDLVVCCEQLEDQYTLATYICSRNDSEAEDLISPGVSVVSEARPSSIAAALVDGGVLVCVADETGLISAYLCDNNNLHLSGTFMLSASSQLSCEMVILSHQGNIQLIGSSRDGNLLVRTLDIAPFSFGDLQSIPFGHTAVKLKRLSTELDRAYAISGTDTCLIRLADHLIINEIWAADKERPDLLQGQIYGCTRLPSSDRLSNEANLGLLGNAFIMLSKNELWIGALAEETAVVLRQIAVSGSPSRVIYTSTQRYIICASVRTSLTESERARRTQARVEVISTNSAKIEMSYDLEPGEEIYSMMEWTTKSTSSDKVHWHILVGSKFLKHGSTTHPRGRVRFLQKRDNELYARHSLNLEAPVYAMALYDDMIFVICYGQYVVLQRFSLDDRKIVQVCQPLRLASIIAAVTCEAPLIYITTRSDSLVTLRVVEQETNDTADSFCLFVDSTSPCADTGLSHTILSLEGVGNELDLDLALMSTDNRNLVGLLLPPKLAVVDHTRTSEIAFRAYLPQSITRIRRCDIRPAWLPDSAKDILEDGLIGCCTDGSIMGLAVINERLWRRLFWLQRLCDWSPVVTPFRYEEPAYDSTNSDDKGHGDRMLPIGLHTQGDIMLSLPDEHEHRARDMHIDGDVLTRLLEGGGASLLRTMIEQTAQRDDHIGQWVIEHLEQELDVVDSVIEELKVLQNTWL